MCALFFSERDTLFLRVKMRNEEKFQRGKNKQSLSKLLFAFFFTQRFISTTTNWGNPNVWLGHDNMIENNDRLVR